MSKVNLGGDNFRSCLVPFQCRLGGGNGNFLAAGEGCSIVFSVSDFEVSLQGLW